MLPPASDKSANGFCNWALLERPWSLLCARYARFVARHPWPFIVVPIIVTVILSTSIFYKFHIVRGVDYLYAPIGAKWKVEEEIFHRNWANTDDQYYPGKDVMRRKGLYLLVTSVDAGSVLRRDQALDFIRLLESIVNSTFVYDGNEYTYADVCLHFQNRCFINDHARLIADIFANGNQVSRKRHYHQFCLQDKFNITYPIYQSKLVGGHQIDLSRALGGVETYTPNGALKSARAWMIVYQLQQRTDRLALLSQQWEITIGKRIQQQQLASTPLIDVVYFHSSSFDMELDEGNRRITPRFALTFFILVFFSVICTITLTRHNAQWAIDWTLSKPWLAVFGVVSNLLAIVSAIGLMLYLDVMFIDMCLVMPFLALSVGIDDMFLMLAAWHATDRNLAVEDRMETSMRHAAVSVTITTLTDALSFYIGSMAPLPAVIPFCLYACTAVCLTFVYTLTMFVAGMALQGQWEKDNRNSLCCCIMTNSIDNIKNLSPMRRLFNVGSRPVPSKLINRLTGALDNYYDIRPWYQRFFEDDYGPFLCRPVVRVIALLTLIAYLTMSIIGARQLNVGFRLRDIVMGDSPVKRFLDYRDEFFPDDYSRVDIAVLRAPQFGDAREREEFIRVLEQLENTSCSAGRNGTDFWLFGYRRYFERLGFGDTWPIVGDNPEQFNEHLRSFLLSNENYAHDILFNDNGIGNQSIRAFRLSIRLVDYKSNKRIMHCANEIRAAADAHKQFNITTYTPLWNLADQFEILLPQTLRNLVIALASMIVISLLFIPQPLCSLVVACTIASIDIGVVGFMSLWRVNLDPTSMITIAMSVGFSVDFAAHIAYGYMVTDTRGDDRWDAPRQRLIGALGALGWPVLQAAISTLLGIGTLANIDSYIVQACFKTVVLVIVFGTLHALVFLPLILYHIHLLIIWIENEWMSPMQKVGVSVSVAPMMMHISDGISCKSDAF